MVPAAEAGLIPSPVDECELLGQDEFVESVKVLASDAAEELFAVQQSTGAEAHGGKMGGADSKEHFVRWRLAGDIEELYGNEDEVEGMVVCRTFASGSMTSRTNRLAAAWKRRWD
jgi:hypothetical protein